MTVFMTICALFGNAIGVLFIVAACTLCPKQRDSTQAGVMFGALFLSIASVLWVAVGLRMVGV